MTPLTAKFDYNKMNVLSTKFHKKYLPYFK